MEIQVNDCRWNVADSPNYNRYWDSMQSGTWEPDTLEFIQRHCGPGSTLIELGAWIGQIALLAASNGATVRSYEPDPVAYKEVAANVACNDLPIDLRNEAVGPEEGTLTLYVLNGFGDSQTSAIPRPGAESIDVPVAKLLDIPRPPRSVLKVDIEGFEFEMLNELKEFCRDIDAVHLSLHPCNLKGRFRLYRQLSQLIDDFAADGLAAEPSTLVAKWRTFKCCVLRRRKKNYHLLFSRPVAGTVGQLTAEQKAA